MTSKCCDRCVQIVVYYVIFVNMFLPTLLMMIGGAFSCVSISDILTAIVWIFSGILLLLGTIQGKEEYMRIYALLTTICLLLGPIYLAVYPDHDAVCENRGTISMVLIILYFVVMWPFQYFVYLFYKQMAVQNKVEPVELDETERVELVIDKTEHVV